MNLKPIDLLPGETVLLSKPANAIIRIDEHGLSRFVLDHLMWTVGMQGREAIGGKLHLTNYRLLFKAHAANRLTGKFSVFLPTIEAVRDTSAGIVKKILVVTSAQSFEFVVWGIPKVLAAVEAARADFGPAQIETLKAAAIVDYEKCGDGLQIVQGIESLNRRLVDAGGLRSLVGLARNSLQGAAILNLLELFAQEEDEAPYRDSLRSQ